MAVPVGATDVDVAVLGLDSIAVGEAVLMAARVSTTIVAISGSAVAPI